MPTGLAAAGSPSWKGGAAINGKIFLCPYSANHVLEFDPLTDTMSGSDQISSDIDGGNAQWFGGVKLNGKLYCIPLNSDYVLVYDTATGLASNGDTSPKIPAVDAVTNRWSRGVSLNGRVYGVPLNADHLLIVDGTTGTSRFSTAIVMSIACCSLQPCMPAYIHVRPHAHAKPSLHSTLTLLCIAGAASLSAKIPGIIRPQFADGNNGWSGGTVIDGKVYGAPANSDYILIYDPSTDVVSGSAAIPFKGYKAENGQAQWADATSWYVVSFSASFAAAQACARAHARTRTLRMHVRYIYILYTAEYILLEY